MTIREALQQASARLGRAGALDARLDALWMLCETTGKTRTDLFLSSGDALSKAQDARFEAMLQRREAGEPLQYVLGTQDFMGHTFRVDGRVLIPRQDTETLCEEAIARVGGACLRVLDVGTGSGALAVSIALACPKAEVTAVDVSADALCVARENAQRLGARVRFLHSDLFTALTDERFDLIVSNPPYIESGEMETLQREVRREPRLALDGGADGLSFYRRLCREAPVHLSCGGVVLFEVGYDQAAAVSSLLKEAVGEPFTRLDLCGIERVVGAVYTE
ncbi:peptide chain release factor N(5)-glutamine methyltransferase [Beduinella massiliensis]|uniref:peptide chain release factor N(5)-glutamine methyltransferase n=1 Tax=Beduinella massiliensis TaxID=1852363 RepID=UPI000C82A138